MRRAASAAAVLAVALAVVGLGSSAALADSRAPYTDPKATSSLALCGKDGKQVTSGSITARPFVWRAVSSSAAPKPYDKAGRTATLFAFQPRPQVDAAQWSGDLLTASARYTDVRHPMAAATDLDEPLADFLDTYPARLDGYVQLRLYLGAPQEPAFTLQYATADIQVSGSTWHRVGAAPDVSCTSGTAVSLEAILPAASPSPTAKASARTTPSTATSTRSAAASTSAVAVPGGSVPSTSTVAAGASTGQTAQDGDGWLNGAVVLALAVLAVAALLWWWWPMRRGAGETE